MYAIVDIAGQQFKVEKDQKLFVHRLEGEAGKKVSFDKVLLLDTGSKVAVGDPLVKGASVTAKIVELSQTIGRSILHAVERFELDGIIAENALTIPMNIPLGVAIVSEVQETGLGCIAHHHDFFWERKRFLSNCVWEYLNQSYPPHLNSIKHVVINTSAVTVLPVTIFTYRAQMGAVDPTDVFLPILMATFCSTLAGLIAVSFFQRIRLHDPVVLAYLSGMVAVVAGLVTYFSRLPQEQLAAQSALLANFTFDFRAGQQVKLARKRCKGLSVTIRKKDYRKFRVRTVEGIDDFASMREVIHRRYTRVKAEALPEHDLILIDGGKGQLSAAVEVLERLGMRHIPVIGLAESRPAAGWRHPVTVRVPPCSARRSSARPPAWRCLFGAHPARILPCECAAILRPTPSSRVHRWP